MATIITVECNERSTGARRCGKGEDPGRPGSSPGRGSRCPYCVGNQPSPEGVQGCVGDWPGVSGIAGAFFGALFRAVVRLRATGFFLAGLARVAFRRVAFFLAGALRFFAAFLATLSPPLIEWMTPPLRPHFQG